MKGWITPVAVDIGVKQQIGVVENVHVGGRLAEMNSFKLRCYFVSVRPRRHERTSPYCPLLLASIATSQGRTAQPLLDPIRDCLVRLYAT